VQACVPHTTAYISCGFDPRSESGGDSRESARRSKGWRSEACDWQVLRRLLLA